MKCSNIIVNETLTKAMKVFFLSSDKSTTSSCDTEEGGHSNKNSPIKSLTCKVTGAFKDVLFSVMTHIALVGHLVQQALLDSQQVGRGRHHYVDQDLRNDGD